MLREMLNCGAASSINGRSARCKVVFDPRYDQSVHRRAIIIVYSGPPGSTTN